MAWDGTELVGTLTLQTADPELWGEQPADSLYLRGLAVRRAYAGQGRELLAWAESSSASTGRRYLRLGCMASNAALRAYYERAGYEHCGDQLDAEGWLQSLYEKALTTAG